MRSWARRSSLSADVPALARQAERLRWVALASTAALVVGALFGVSGNDDGSAAGAGPGACDDVEVSLRPLPPEGSQRGFSVVVANAGDRPCLLPGVPRVALVGPDHPEGGRHELPPASGGPGGAPGEQVLAPSAAAEAELRYLSGRWRPDEVEVELPGGATVTLAWPGRGVLRQDGATRPGTWVAPFARL